MRRRRMAVVGTAAVVGRRSAERQEASAQQQQAEQQQAAPAPAPQATPAPAPAGNDLTSQLNQLAQLHASGVLTDEEFSAAKQKVLAGG
jgi:hypothetical protein